MHMKKQKRYRPKSKNNNRPKSKFTHRISEHFSKKDFIFRDENGKESVKISLCLVGGLELLRSIAKSRINILKGYVTPEVAEKEKSLKRNFHVLGKAADITIDKLTPKEIVLFAELVPEFKGIGLNITENYVHVDTRQQEERVMWVVENGVRTEITLENRNKYLEPPLPAID